MVHLLNFVIFICFVVNQQYKLNDATEHCLAMKLWIKSFKCAFTQTVDEQSDESYRTSRYFT